jgi:hypothetical protein
VKNDDLNDRLARYRQIKLSFSRRKSGEKQSRFLSGSCWKVRSSTSYQCRARARSGTGTCSKTRRFGLMREARNRNSGQAESPITKL